MNGHLINGSVKRYPDFCKSFCDQCGAKTITTCPNCGHEIEGEYHVEGVISVGGFEHAPAFCHNCGKAFPWTEARVKAAQELAREVDGISEDEKALLEKSIGDLIKDGPNTTLAATRFKKIMSKAGKTAAGAFKDILVDVASEAAKKMIWP